MREFINKINKAVNENTFKDLHLSLKTIKESKDIFITAVFFLNDICYDRLEDVRMNIKDQDRRTKGILLNIEYAGMMYMKRTKEPNIQDSIIHADCMGYLEESLSDELKQLKDCISKALRKNDLNEELNERITQLYLVAYLGYLAKDIYMSIKILFKALNIIPPRRLKKVTEELKFDQFAVDLVMTLVGWFDASIIVNDKNCKEAQEDFLGHLLRKDLYDQVLKDIRSTL